jgi:uncharacterized CHY-type Zn-finger protein
MIRTLAHRERGIREAWACAPIHLVSSAGRGGLRHRSSPLGRSWPRGDAVLQVFLDIFRQVASLCLKYFSCFRCMFQLFHANVAKVDRDVAYVAMVVHVCCKRLSPMFHLFFIHVCCKCFICLLLYLNVFKSRSGCLHML